MKGGWVQDRWRGKDGEDGGRRVDGWWMEGGWREDGEDRRRMEDGPALTPTPRKSMMSPLSGSLSLNKSHQGPGSTSSIGSSTHVVQSSPTSPSTSNLGAGGGSNYTVVTKKNMLAMKRVLTIAHQLGNNLCESWAIVLDTLDAINTTLVDTSTVVVENEITDARAY
jgi:hypothetical protein